MISIITIVIDYLFTLHLGPSSGMRDRLIVARIILSDPT